MRRSREGILEGRLELEVFSFGGELCLMFGKKGFSNGELISIPEFLSPVQQNKSRQRQEDRAIFNDLGVLRRETFNPDTARKAT